MINTLSRRSSREYLANPFPKETYKERLLKSKAIDLKDNCSIKDYGNGYSKIVIKNKNNFMK